MVDLLDPILILSDITDVTMSVTDLNSLDDGLNSALHFHDSDRARANHTGTQLASTISDFDTQVRTSRIDQMAIPTADLNMNTNQIKGVVDPTLDQDAATKKYVDDNVSANTLAGLTDTTISSRLANQALVVNSGNTAWINALIADANIAVHTSTKITITAKGQLNSNIVYTDQANVFGAFAQRFPTTQLQLDNPAQTFQYIFATSAIVTANKTVTLPLLTANDTFVFNNFAAVLANKTLTTPTIADFTNATHDHLDAAGGGTITKAAISDFAHQATHQSGGGDALTGLLDATARTSVSKNSTADVGARRTLNFIEGANVTLTIADDAGGEEVDITIASTAGGGSPLTTKGDIFGFDTGNARIPVGANNLVLMADSALGLGVKYALIADANVDASAAIVLSKLENLTSSEIIVGSAGNVPTAVSMSGDVAIIASGATTIQDEAVTLAKMAHIATARILGRVTAATGDVEVLTGTQATTLIDVFTSALKGLVPASGGSATEFLSADGTFKVPGGGGDMVLADIQTVTGAKTFGTIGGAVGKFILAGSTSGSTIVNAAAIAGATTITFPGTTGTVALTSDLTGFFDTAGTGLTSSGSTVNVIGTASRITANANDIDIASDYVGQTSIVTIGVLTAGTWNATDIVFANIQQIATDRLLGRQTAATGDIEEISLNSTLELVATTTLQRAALTGDVTAAAGSNTTVVVSVPDGALSANVVLETITNVYGAFLQNFAAATLRLPNSDTASVSADGDIAFDNLVTDWTTGILRVFGSGEEQGIVTMPIVQFTTPSDGDVVSYNATNDEFELVPQTGGAGEANVTADVGGGAISIRGSTPKSGVALNLRTFANGDGMNASEATDLITLAVDGTVARNNALETFNISDAGTNTVVAAVNLLHTTSADMINAFGVSLQFQIDDAVSSVQTIGAISVERSAGDDDAGTMRIQTSGVASGLVDAIIIDDTQVVSVVGTLTAGTYTGQSSIVTVGTIGTGVWEGTSVASAFLDADTMHLSVAQTVNGAKTFLDTDLLLRNVANTFNGRFTNTNTVDRVYTLQDADGTVAFLSDVVGEANTHSSLGGGSFALTAATPKTGVNLNLISVSNGDGMNASLATDVLTLAVASTVVQTDQVNVYGDFLQTFKDNIIKINSPDDADGVTLVNSNQTTDRNLTIPVLTGNRNFVVTTEASQITLGTEVTGAITNLSDVTAKTGSGTTVVFDASPTIVTPTIASFANAAHDHEDAAGGAQLDSTLALSDTANIAYLNTANSYIAGTRQDFLGLLAGTAGLNVGGIAGNPTTQVDGDVWYNSSTNTLFGRINGADVDLGQSGSEIFTWTANHSMAGFNLISTGSQTTDRINLPNLGAVGFENNAGTANETLHLSTSDQFEFSAIVKTVGTGVNGFQAERTGELANGDVIGNYAFRAEDGEAVPVLQAYVRITGTMEDDTNANEEGSISFEVMEGGSPNQKYMHFNDAGGNTIQIFRDLQLEQNAIDFNTDGHSITPNATQLIFDLGATTDSYLFRTGIADRFSIEETKIVAQDPLFILESAAAVVDAATFGQYWVRNDANQAAMFTDEAGVDYRINPKKAIEFVIDGGGSEIGLGVHGDIEIPNNFEVERVTMLADQSGSIVVDIWMDTYALFPPTDADSITASAPPTITTDTDSQDSTLTGWTTALVEGSILRYNVDSVTTIQRVTISLWGRYT